MDIDSVLAQIVASSKKAKGEITQAKTNKSSAANKSIFTRWCTKGIAIFTEALEEEEIKTDSFTKKIMSLFEDVCPNS